MALRTVSAIATVAALLLVSVPPTAAGQCPTCIAGDTVRQIRDTEEDQVIPVGWYSYQLAKDCVEQGSCPHLEDVAFKDVDISEEMESYEDGASFELAGSLGLPTGDIVRLWLVCSYDAAGELEDCFFDQLRGWGLSRSLGPDARELRIFVIDDMAVEYHLTVHAY